jgi:Tol biopolymer transport system component
MRTIVAAVALTAALRLPVGEEPAVITIAQSDNHRSFVDAPSVAVSADGGSVAFTSFVQLAPADTNNQRDIYVLARADGRVTLESVTPEGGAFVADSINPSISGDGRLVVFESCLPSTDTSLRRTDVILRDRRAAMTKVLSRSPSGDVANGWSRAPSISSDGRIAVFASSATNLVAALDANGAGEDIYLVEIATGAIRRISVGSDGVQPSTGSSISPSVSPDGRYVAFVSSAPLDAPVASARENPVDGPGSRARLLAHVYVHDTRLNTTRRVSVGPSGRTADGESWGPVISANGRYVVFVSAAANLVADDRNSLADVFVADLQTGSIELISRSARGMSANGSSGSPAISTDGRFVAFQSEASDLVCGRCGATKEDINLLWDVFLFDRTTRLMTRMSADQSGGWMEGSGGPALDAAGRIVAFSSRHPVDANDRKNDFDLFIMRRH